ncbi:thymocyte nuclear protein 1 [Hordeum vulgare]|uniref:EVE domain-containing protein n=1 Tax=Hordeum vulgare subsp. vulgare TaxID=112509 RepID=A0A8I6XBR4_HORVV|nr:thymocyte nuclear protein 1 [Hordeum vulgare subsp. vulgare]XP_044979560.1 thymocyte nuclear protein 1 [Hordeum vulgare subsp. vulgare]KAE8776419.1 thymocyte nuclear protein 1 [Hordeum vulgare]
MVGIPRAFSIPSPQFPANIRSLSPPAIAAALNPHRMPRKAARGVAAASKKVEPTPPAAKKKSTAAAGKKAAPTAAKKAAPAASKYWLLKTEPGEWSWTDQAGAPGGVGPWDGVRNHQAMNNLRAMRRGDRCLFYHSGAGAASRRVVGVVEVAREWYEGEEGEATAGGAVDVRAVGEFQRPVALGEIKKAAAAGEVEGMKDFALIRQARLSVMPVPVAVWDWICETGGGFVEDGEVGDDEASSG